MNKVYGLVVIILVRLLEVLEELVGDAFEVIDVLVLKERQFLERHNTHNE